MQLGSYKGVTNLMNINKTDSIARIVHRGKVDHKRWVEFVMPAGEMLEGDISSMVVEWWPSRPKKPSKATKAGYHRERLVFMSKIANETGKPSVIIDPDIGIIFVVPTDESGVGS
jgi:hypothetical protein